MKDSIKIPDIFELKIDSLAYKGSGVSRYKDLVCFVPFTVPGDLVQVRLKKQEKTFLIAEVIQILEKSQDRREPFCEYFGVCGGCNWQNVQYKRQLMEKQLLLTETIKRMTGIECNIKKIIASPSEYSYRNSIRLKCSKDGNIGFYASSSHNLVDIKSCKIADQRLNNKLSGIRKNITKYNKIPKEIVLQVNNEGLVSDFPVKEQKKGSGFNQVNTVVNKILKEEIYKNISEYSKEVNPLKILDLFCGDGNLSLHLADIADDIFGYDISGRSIKKGNRSAAALENKNILYKNGSVENLLKTDKLQKLNANCLIIDPPRNGLKGITQQIAKLDIPRIIYISCVPPVLARDLKELIKSGYKIDFLQPLDMFPQTYHIETLAVLTRI